MAEDRMRGALQTIFSFFLGLMVLAFIAVGVNTFYESPQAVYSADQLRISRAMEALNTKGSADQMTPDQRIELAKLQAQQNALQDKIDALAKDWARNTSIVLVLFATIVMSVSLVRSDQLRVISNGLLLGGLFTMLYGAGWVIFSGTSTARFLVIGFALLVTVALGYLKFVRDRASAIPAAVGGRVTAADIEGLGDIEARIAALESRTAAAAAALGAGEARAAVAPKPPEASQ